MFKSALTLVAFASLLGSQQASAEMKPKGSFVPTYCSAVSSSNLPSIQIVAVKSVCLGKLVGMTGKAVSLQLNDGSSRQYVIQTKGQLGGMGQSKATFTGQDRAGDENKTIAGKLEMTSGITTNYRIQLSTSDNLAFTGTLHMVYTTL